MRADRSDPAARATQPLTIRLPPARLKIMRLIAALVIGGPLLGVGLAVGLFAAHGVGTVALIGFAVTYAASTLGVTLGFHRYFAHRAFRTGRTMQAVFVILGSCAMQGPLLYWVATHRRHHQFSDGPCDPHSPHTTGDRELTGWAGLWHGHLGWMFSGEMTNPLRFAPDILRDRRIFLMQRYYLLWATLVLLIPGIVGGLVTQSLYGGLETFLWAGPVRLLLVHHASWAVGSISHMYGARPFPLPDHSANNLWVAVLAFGEGLQNNHHAFPRAAHHGFRWWEPDLSGLVLNGLEWIGLVWDVNRPAPAALAARRRGLVEVEPHL
jgi:stearoyl-CoA desaturase (delta-9 desaturase)